MSPRTKVNLLLSLGALLFATFLGCIAWRVKANARARLEMPPDPKVVEMTARLRAVGIPALAQTGNGEFFVLEVRYDENDVRIRWFAGGPGEDRHLSDVAGFTTDIAAWDREADLRRLQDKLTEHRFRFVGRVPTTPPPPS